MLKIINILLLQWFFVRIVKQEEKIITEFNMLEVSIMPNGNVMPAGKFKYKVYKWYSLQYWVTPLTRLKEKHNKHKFLRITHKIEK